VAGQGASTSGGSSGCGCALTSRAADLPGTVLVALAAAGIIRRRRRRS